VYFLALFSLSFSFSFFFPLHSSLSLSFSQCIFALSLMLIHQRRRGKAPTKDQRLHHLVIHINLYCPRRSKKDPRWKFTATSPRDRG
jgi:hypothetical protein